MSGQYQDFPEIMSAQQLAKLMKVSKETVYAWFRSNKTPFGEIALGVHYFKSGKELRIVKDRLCQLVGILPKANKDSCEYDKINNIGTITTVELNEDYIKAAVQYFNYLNEIMGLKRR